MRTWTREIQLRLGCAQMQMPKMFQSSIVILVANFVFVAPATFVPRINNDNGFQLVPNNDGYTLSIREPDNTNWREETVKEVAPGELEVKGILNQAFKEDGGTLVVVYEAGRNGYVAKYIYEGSKKPTPAPHAPYQILLSAKALMSAAG
ncbi:uncharacterized protein LOC132792256 [Drosophila nasuta]|uniref:uncharacterized protein LOC132792256 n=1 Tax=Drosophila nasuta TaxID=42062 RepID=UPI00295E2224|nr:uncharacterized protein LOC132792256 [Drosophila nasuta]